jgi:hypothetical protein
MVITTRCLAAQGWPSLVEQQYARATQARVSSACRHVPRQGRLLTVASGLKVTWPNRMVKRPLALRTARS